MINKEDPSGLFICTGCSPPLAPWELNPCRPFGATYLLNGMDLYAGFFCGGLLPSIPDLIDTFLPGSLKVQSSCQNVIYLPEAPDPDGPEDWGPPQDDVWQDSDVVATPRGIVKIPNGCGCSVECNNGANYKIICTCSVLSALGRVGINAPRVLAPGQEFPDPRRAGYFWVSTGIPYVRNGGLPCISCGTTEWVFN